MSYPSFICTKLMTYLTFKIFFEVTNVRWHISHSYNDVTNQRFVTHRVCVELLRMMSLLIIEQCV